MQLMAIEKKYKYQEKMNNVAYEEEDQLIGHIIHCGYYEVSFNR